MISDRIKRLSDSQTIAMAQKSRELREQGIDIVNLSIGEPDFNTPEHIKEAAIEAIRQNYSHYTPIAGFLSLREAISKKLKVENHLDYDPSQIIVSTGAKQSLTNTLLAIINPGDEVIVPAPYWVSYPEMVKLAGGENVYIQTGVEEAFKITPDQLEEAITPKTKAFLFSSPSNPSGAVYTRDELKELAGVFAKHSDIIIISDEIYEYINYRGGHESIAQFDEIKARVVVVNGVSKGFAMTGWRIGFAAANETIAKACAKVQGQYTSGTSAVSQRAAEAAYNGPRDECIRMKEAFEIRRDLICGLASQIPGMEFTVPDGAFYLLPNISTYLEKKNGFSTPDLCMRLLIDHKVAVVPGEAFGAPNCIRISYAASEENIREGMKRLKEGLANL